MYDCFNFVAEQTFTYRALKCVFHKQQQQHKKNSNSSSIKKTATAKCSLNSDFNLERKCFWLRKCSSLSS